VVVVATGLDLMDMAPQLMGASGDVARRFMAARRLAAPMQNSFTSIEKVRDGTPPPDISPIFIKLR